MTAPSQPTKRQGDLSVTALYTSQAWINGGFEDAELFATRDAKVAFKVTNFILGLLRIFKPGPVLPCSMAQRHAMFDHVVRSSGATQVIEIAAGLSRRGAAFSKDPNLRYVEIDLPGMIASKRELLERTEAGQLILQRPNLTFVPADVRDIDLESCVEPGRPACFAAEGLFMFLAAAEQRALWQRIARALAKAPQGTFVFDLIPVVEEWRAGRVGRLLDGLLKRATNGATYVNDNRTRHDIASDLKDAGFATVEFLEPAPLLDAWRLPFPEGAHSGPHVPLHHGASGLDMQPIPATPLDIEMHSWDRIGAGEFAASFQADFAAHLDEQLLESALQLLVGAEPVLGCRLVTDVDQPYWQPLDRPLPRILVFTRDEEEYERLSSDSPNATIGPQLSALLWRSPARDSLIVKLNHAAGDGTSVLYALERLADIYTKLGLDPGYIPPVGTGRRDMGQVLKFVPKRAYLGVARDWLKFGLTISIPRATHHIGLPLGADHPWHYLRRRIPPDRVSALSQYGRARGATLNDVFLASFYRALVTQGHWDGKAALRALCTIDLRQWFIPERRVEAVCNLSSGELPFLGRDLGVDYEDTLGRVAKIMNARKRSNPGLAIALLCPKIGKHGLTEKRLKRTSEIFQGAGMPIFTNTGRIDGARISFAGQAPNEAYFLSFKANLPKLVIAMTGYNGSLTLTLGAADSARPIFEAFLDEFLANLPV